MRHEKEESSLRQGGMVLKYSYSGPYFIDKLAHDGLFGCSVVAVNVMVVQNAVEWLGREKPRGFPATGMPSHREPKSHRT